MNETFDAIVIGSGMGGLTAAALLSRISGRRVLVLERHTQLGGLTHVFRRQGASWDVGLHYVGDLQPGSWSRRLMDYLTRGAVKWRKLPEEFERYRLPGLEARQGSDFAGWRRTLERLFPAESRGIRAWFRDLEAAARWNTMSFAGQFMPALLAFPLKIAAAVTRRRPLRTTAQVLSKRVRDPLLRLLLTATWGDYGLVPEDSAFAIHALIATHYRHGAWFPEGGSGRLARAMEAGIEEAGELCLVGWEVEEILRDASGRVRGVRARNTGGTGETREFSSAVVVSDTGALATFDRLIRGKTSRSLEKLRRQLRAVPPGFSAVSLYLRFRESPAKLGVQGENWWIYATKDIGSLQRQSSALLAGQPENAFLSFPSLKNGDPRFHTGEIIASVLPEAFARWQDQPHGGRDPDYLALKERISQGLLALVEKEVPGLSALVSYRELSTPLSVEHYDAREGGRFYGLAARPQRYRIRGLRARTPVRGLTLAGSDVGSLGIMGAIVGGVAAATAILGGSSFPKIMAEVSAFASRGGAAGTPTGTLRTVRHPARFQAVLAEKRWVAPEIAYALFELDRPLSCLPGQFAKLEVQSGEWRDYSVVEASGNHVRFLVSTATGGDGSIWFRQAQPGDRLRLEGPYGTFRLDPGEHPRVFVATGTGLAPLLPMMRALEPCETRPGLELLLGSRTLDRTVLAEPARKELETRGARVTLCLSREQAQPPAFNGRVTQALEELPFEAGATDFYLCGAPEMVNDATAVLLRRGARRIFSERY